MKKYVCIHGHFYQPPRENPWLGRVERQLSAAPFHDWNERVHHECYAPNTKARILSPNGERQVNNYEKISFNFGPTLLDWIEKNQPQDYAAIVEADHRSRKHFGGHGSALAQVFNHAILPLQNKREQMWQVQWGLDDFKRRFGRDAEGMWLAECAVDVQTLEVMAECGVRFTVLAPHQFKAFAGTQDAQAVDTRKSYRCVLPSGSQMFIFFYHGPVSQGIAFQGLLNKAETFKSALEGIFNDPLSNTSEHSNASEQQALLANVATDGESYGHHHRFGEMALAYTLHLIEQDPALELSNYAQFLELYPPQDIVEIVSPSSWSCAHGVLRWIEDCGCGGDHKGGQLQWRTPLRKAFQYLADQAWTLADQRLKILGFDNPEKVLSACGPLLFGGLEGWSKFPLASQVPVSDRQEFLELVKLVKYSQWAFTSCAWFFDDVARLEPRQNLLYAERVLELMEKFSQELSQGSVDSVFLDILSQAHSNRHPTMSARELYLSEIRPFRCSLERRAAQAVLMQGYGFGEESLLGAGLKVRWLKSTKSNHGSEQDLFEIEVRRSSTGESAVFDGYFVQAPIPKVNLRRLRQQQAVSTEQISQAGMRSFGLEVLSYDQKELLRDGPFQGNLSEHGQELQSLLRAEHSLFDQ